LSTGDFIVVNQQFSNAYILAFKQTNICNLGGVQLKHECF